ncbi:MAG: hypothetical protein LUF89_01885 [Ruminococcus sp.]|nr:hypothetical protein [Ruminococcus sp.]
MANTTPHTPEEYREEMLRLYRASHIAVKSETTPKPKITPEPEIKPSAQPEAQTATGWIQVITRTGMGGMALPGVSVIIVDAAAGETHLNQDESHPPYGTFDVHVFASGYYRQISKAVPVFAGVTSRQVFSMIPLPADLTEEPEPMTFENPEPLFSRDENSL